MVMTKKQPKAEIIFVSADTSTIPLPALEKSRFVIRPVSNCRTPSHASSFRRI
jgi:hypothetical protein